MPFVRPRSEINGGECPAGDFAVYGHGKSRHDKRAAQLRFHQRANAQPGTLNGASWMLDRETLTEGFSLRLGEFMFDRRHFPLHVAHPDVPLLAARTIEEVNDSARRAAKQNNEEAHRADQLRYRHIDMTEVA